MRGSTAQIVTSVCSSVLTASAAVKRPGLTLGSREYAETAIGESGAVSGVRGRFPRRESELHQEWYATPVQSTFGKIGRVPSAVSSADTLAATPGEESLSRHVPGVDVRATEHVRNAENTDQWPTLRRTGALYVACAPREPSHIAQRVIRQWRERLPPERSAKRVIGTTDFGVDWICMSKSSGRHG